MSRRLLLLATTHGLVAAAMLGLGWEAARFGAGFSARARLTAPTGPVRPPKPFVSAQGSPAAGPKTARATGPEEPAAFVAWAKTFDRRFVNDPNSADCVQLRTIFQRDRGRALEIAMLGRKENCPHLFTVFVIEWTRCDLAGALAWARQLDSETSAAAMQEVPSGITPENAADAARSFLPELPEGRLRYQTMQAIYSNWSTGAPVACFTWLRSLPRPDALRLLDQDLDARLPSLLGADPAGVSEFVRNLPQNEQVWRVWQETARALVSIDPSMAIEWAGSLDSSAARALCLDNAWMGWALDDIRAATTAALAQTDPARRRQAIEVLAQAVVRGRLAEANAWMDALPGGLRSVAEAGIFSETIADAEPSAGAAALAKMSAESEATDEMLPIHAWTLGGRLAREDPEEAASWAAVLAPGREQTEAARGVASTWAYTDPVATRAWIESLPPGTARDGAAAGLAGHLAGADPGTAFGLAASIGSPGHRAAAFNDVIDQWKFADASAARESIESSALDPDEKQALLGRLSLPKRRSNMVIWK